MSQAVDTFGRIHKSLRISVTDRCNLRCQYCMPVEGVSCARREELLTFEEIVFVVDVATSLGVDRIRITGGEPLLRRNLTTLIRQLKEDTDVVDVAMTTNGLLLSRHVAALAEAGLDRVNISLDSLRPDRFRKITRHGLLKTAWSGVEAAIEAGFSPLRINALLLRGFNDDEVDQWLELTTTMAVDVRFMELMPIGEGAKANSLGTYMDLTQLRRRLAEQKGLVPAEVEVGNGPARYWKLPGAPGRVGFITPLSDSYCNSCSRMRLTSTGQLRACLAADRNFDLSAAIRDGDREAVRAGFMQALKNKPAGHRWRNGQVTRAEMSALGG